MKLRCVALTLLATLAMADFELNQVAGLYFLVRGPPSCEEDIRLHQSVTTVRGSQIRGRNFECQGGVIEIERGTTKNGNVFTKWFAEGPASIGVFLVGKVKEQIHCGQRGGGHSSFNKGQVWNFVDTRTDVVIDFFKLLTIGKKDKDLRKGLAHEKELILRDEIEYLVIGDQCVYRQSWYVCFPASATVQTRQGTKRMDDVELGDEVLVGPGKYSRIFMWTHRAPAERSTFVRLHTDAGRNVTMTPSHYLRASGRLTPAGKVRVGDTVHLGDGRVSSVVRIDLVEEQGFFNPQTLHGDVVVDGVVTSTYTKAIRPRKAHAMLAPLRAFYKAAVWTWLGVPHSSEL